MDWTKGIYSMDWLIDKALTVPECYRGTVFDWLKVIGVVPHDIEKVRPVLALIDTDGTKMRAGYLAASAYEWDGWGESQPIDFVKAIRLETKGYAGRDVIAETLTALGRSTEMGENLAY